MISATMSENRNKGALFMKRLLCLGMAVGLSLGMAMTSFAEYVPPTSYSANKRANERNQIELENAKQRVEWLESEIVKDEQYLTEHQDEYESDLALCAEYEAANKVTETAYLHAKEDIMQYQHRQRSLEDSKRLLEEAKGTVTLIEGEIADATQEALSWGGTSTEESKNDTYVFRLEYGGSQWLLNATYRSWTPAHGGMWEYSSFISPSLGISLYDGNNCLSSLLARAEGYDTDEELYWYVPSSLTDGKRYYIEINGQRYGVVAHNYSGSPESWNTESSEDSGESWTGGTINTSTAVTVGMSITGELAQTYHWVQNEKGWWVENSTGSYPVNQWYQSPASGLWYFMGADGYMMTNATTPDGYYVNFDGVWVH